MLTFIILRIIKFKTKNQNFKYNFNTECYCMPSIVIGTCDITFKTSLELIGFKNAF